MELNSSIQQTPPSASTSAPASRCHCPESLITEKYYVSVWFHYFTKFKSQIAFYSLTLRRKRITLTAVTVNPALVVPIPVVRTERGLNLQMYLRICDLPAPGSPTNSKCDSPRAFVPDSSTLDTPPARMMAADNLTI